MVIFAFFFARGFEGKFPDWEVWDRLACMCSVSHEEGLKKQKIDICWLEK
jgi:hypothetical protein